MEEREALVALNMIEHVGPVRLRLLLEHFGSAVEILAAGKRRILQLQGIGDETAEAIARWETSIDLKAEWDRIEKFQCRILIPADETYPELLRQIYDPPIVLYVKGALSPKDKNGVAVVGSRMTTYYGIESARRLAWQLAALGVTVVSGGARGIDTAAHQGALSGGGRTVAVLGTGINLVFPSENKELFERIAARGAVITQFPFNRQADRQTFPIRNRIVAGMTLGTVVVEANLTSGALITANMAADNGRHVFAVPGRVDSPRSKGCHDLIKKGAKLCECAEDIVSEFEYLFPASNRSAPEAPSEAVDMETLSPQERAVFAQLSEEETHIDAVARGAELSAAVVAVALLNLEIKRLVRQLPGKRFVRQSGIRYRA